MLEYVLGCSQKIGGPNKIVEIDDSKFGRRNYKRGHAVKGQWVFGGVEHESGRTFLVPIPDRTAVTLMPVICDWIEPGTTVISDCGATYRDVAAHGYTHLTVNHFLSPVDEHTGAHTNNAESTWPHVKA
jgi:transposase-like protein